MPRLTALVLASALLLSPLAQAAKPEQAVGVVLDQLHQLASQARFEPYFSLYAPDGVFIGTDAGERWTVAQFKAYAKPHFDKGHGWTYTVVERHVSLAADGSHAWFDELLDNTNLGRCRGTGVLRKIKGQWKIEQYHLTIPVPNDLAEPVVKLIREQTPTKP